MHTPLVAAILPCRGRPEQTVAVARRLLETAGDVPAEWYAVAGTDDHEVCQQIMIRVGTWIELSSFGPRLTYWQALAAATEMSKAPLLCCLANDLAPGADWLKKGLSAFLARFPDGQGLMGFAGDGHPPHHSCHFLISRGLLEVLGGWPTVYDHNFGDAELCQRAQLMGRYGKAIHAVLEHKHPNLRTASDDAVYQEGRAQWKRDQATFMKRRAEWLIGL